MEKTFEKVYGLVCKIPKGKVTTYGEIARALSISPRIVGFALNKNKNPSKIPCHRVVNRNGRVAKGYAFGGVKVQREKLQAEGIKFITGLQVNLKNHFFKF